MKLFNKSIDHKLFLSSFIVITLAELANTFTCLIDGVMTGRFLGNEAMSAYGLASPYFSIAAIVSGVLMVSCQTLCTTALSRGDREEANKIFSTTMVIAMIGSIVLTLSILLFPNQICAMLGAKGESQALLVDTKNYLMALGSSCPLMVFIAISIPILQLDGAGKKAKMSSLVIAIIDILFDALNVFVLKWGMFGMGLASSLSYVGACIVILSHFRSKDCYFKFSFKYLTRNKIKPIIVGGIPRGIMRLCEAVGPIVLNIMVVSIMGVVGIEALSIQRNIAFLIGTMGWGIAGASMQTTALYFAEKDKEGIGRMLKIAHRYNLIFGIGVSVIVIILSNTIASLYIPTSGEVRDLARIAIIAYALRVFFINFNFITANYAQVIGRIGIAFFGNIASGFAYLLPLTYFFGTKFGSDGFWMGFPLSEALISLTLLLLMIGLNNGKIGGCLLMLNKSFDISNNRRLYFVFKDKSSSLELSKKIQDFSNEIGIDGKRAYKLALCVEEMVMSIFENGFNDGKEHMIEIRISYDVNDIIIRIRDDCELQDLKEKVKNWSEQETDPMRNIGIRLTLAVAKDVSYTSIMGTNNLLITL